MKKSVIYLTCAFALGLWSCSSEENIPSENQNGNEGDVYATLSLNLGTRSVTVDPGSNPAQSNAGFEYGQDYENKVNDVVIVLAQKNQDTNVYTFISAASGTPMQVSNSENGAAGKPNPLYKLKFNTNDIIEYAGKDVSVFAYCNPSAALTDILKSSESWSADLEYSGITDLIWEKGEKNGNFLMTSALSSDVTLPSKTAMETVYNKETNPCDLGTVKVERVAARFDFTPTKVGTLEANQYPIYALYNNPSDANDNVGSGLVGSGDVLGYVELDGMALVNQSEKFYLLSRVAAGTTDNTAADMSAITLLGKETTNNWVISPSDKIYSSWFGTTDNAYAPSSFVYDAISNIVKKGNEDNDQNWNQDASLDQYYMWRYTTENTIPSIAAQKYGITTGVLFRGIISAPTNSSLSTALSSGNPIYAYEGVMYGTLTDLIDYVSKLPGSDVAIAFQESFNATIDLNDLTTTEDIKKYLTDRAQNLAKSDANFNMYTPTNVDGNPVYYVYYFYPNRHNDNGNNTEMGRMEFATVRNNVYKLKVNNIYKWGNPGDKPFDPGTDDESPEVYFKVQVEVLPWVVRINNIDF